MFFAYLAWAALYQFIFSFASLFPTPKRPTIKNKIRKIAVFIPCYKEDAVINSVAEAALKQSYPSEKYDVIVIADSLREETLNSLNKLAIKVIQVSFKKSTKSKALNRSLAQLTDTYEMAVILDADNVMANDFLERMNQRFNEGSVVVQGRRVAKNYDTPMAILDAASEDINNRILCKGHQLVGLSVRLAGSAMAFDYKLFKKVMKSVNAVGGFDKELELKFTQAGIKLDYDHHAQVYDEKVRKPAHLTKQRSRWIAAQFHYANQYLPKGFKALLLDGRVDFFNKSIQMALPPRIFLPVLLFTFTFVSFLIGSSTFTILWGSALAINILSFLIATPSLYFRRHWKAVFFGLPIALFSSFKALLKVGNANKKFIHTPHTFVDFNTKTQKIK